jgi:hypothetical protein
LRFKLQTFSLRRTDRWRSVALVAGGAVAVHQLRYALSPVPQAVFELRHAYFTLLAVPVALGLLIGIVTLAGQLLAGGRPCASRPEPAPFGARWLRSFLTLLVIFVVQESVEAVVHPGREAATGVVWSHGSTIAVALTILVGALIALLEHEAEKAIRTGRARFLRAFPLGLVPRPTLQCVAAGTPRSTFLTDSPGRAPPFAPVLA